MCKKQQHKLITSIKCTWCSLAVGKGSDYARLHLVRDAARVPLEHK